MFEGIFMEKKSGIYKIEWNEGYFYYGQTSDFSSRKNCHLSSLNRKSHHNIKLQRVFNKYGMPSFTIVEKCEVKKLDIREQYYIDKNIGNKLFCNILPTAGSFRGYKLSDERKKILSERARKRIGILNANYGNRGKRNPIFGTKRSEITRKKMGDSQRGELNCMYGRKSQRAILVLNYETGIFYDSIMEAAKTINMLRQNLASAIRGERKNNTAFILI